MKTVKRTGSILSVLLIKLAIILMLLLVASYLKLRLDFSQNKAYSLSAVSKEAVRKLKDNLVVKIYASEELPPEMTSLDRYVKDLLSEYQVAGRGKFHYEFIRGLSMDELRVQAQENGLKSMYFSIYENDKTTNKEVIYGLVFEYQGKFDAINLMPRTEAKLEYELTRKVQKLTRYTLPEVTVYKDSLYTMMPTKVFDEGMLANYEVIDTDLMTPPKQTKVMIFTGATDSLSVTQLYNLDQYLMKGGSLVVLQDRVNTDGRSIKEIKSNIFPLLESYGLKVNPEIAMDIFCDIRQMGVDTSLSFPIYPVLRGMDHPITRNISDIVMYMANGLQVINRPGLKFRTILATSTSSALLDGPDYLLDRELFERPDPQVFNHPPIPMGVIMEGKFESYFKDKPQYQATGFVSENPKGKIVAYGDRELTIDSDKAIFADRFYIILNAVDWLLGRDSMISIRSRHLQSSILDIPYYMHKHELVWGDPVKIERRLKTGIKVVSIALPSLLLIGLGAFMALRRKQILGEYTDEKK
jgi:gliding-associated putative ABC transporter substrate-binding component GldG